jgi:hypothetical protein
MCARFKIALGCALAFSSMAYAMFTGPNSDTPPTGGNTWVLDHHKTYVWRIDVSVPGNESITGATINISNLNNWRIEPGDITYFKLFSHEDLQTIDSDYMNWENGFYTGTDTKASGDAFADIGFLLDTYSDEDSLPENYQYTFTEAELALLNTYASDGVFGFGLDPDCRYYNNGIQFDIEITNDCSVIPTPGSLLLAGIGISAVGWLRRKRSL